MPANDGAMESLDRRPERDQGAFRRVDRACLDEGVEPPEVAQNSASASPFRLPSYVNGDIALTSADWKGQIRQPDGTVQTVSGTTTTEVSVRQPDGSWKMVIDDPLF